MIVSKYKIKESPLMISEVMLFLYVATLIVLNAVSGLHIIPHLIALTLLFVFCFEVSFKKGLPTPRLLIWPIMPLIGLALIQVAWLPAFYEAGVLRLKSAVLLLPLTLIIINITRITSRTWFIEYGLLLGLAYIWQSGSLEYALLEEEGTRFKFSMGGVASDEDSLNPNMYGLYCAMYIFFVLRFVFTGFLGNKKTFIKLTRFSIAIATSTFAAQQVITLTGSRKCMILLMIMAVGSYFLYSRGRLKISRILPAVFIGSLITAFAAYKISSSAFAERFESMFYGLAGQYSGDASFDTRSQMISGGLNLWFKSPLWGNGNEAFRVDSGFGTYSHSTVIELLCNYGLLGFLCFYLYLFTIGRGQLRILNSENEESRAVGIWGLVGLICLIFWSLFAVCFYEKIIYIVLAALCGVSHHYRERSKLYLS